MSLPPFVDNRGDVNRTCCRWMGSSPCGAAPVEHIIWTDPGDGVEHGLVCPEHAKEIGPAARWTCLARHDFDRSVCDLPGSMWHSGLNVCYFPPSAPESPELRTTVSVSQTHREEA